MKRTTVFLDESLLKRLHHVGRADGKTFAAIVREALTAYLAARGAAAAGRVPSIAGQFASGELAGTALSEEPWLQDALS